MPVGLMALCEELCVVCTATKQGNEGLHSGLASAMGSQLATDPQLEVEAWVRKLEEELRLEKKVQRSTTLLASGLANKMGEQDNKLETSACRFAKLGEYKLTRIKVWTLLQSLWDPKRWDPWESEESKEEDVMMIDNEMDKIPLIKRKTKTQQQQPQQVG